MSRRARFILISHRISHKQGRGFAKSSCEEFTPLSFHYSPQVFPLSELCNWKWRCGVRFAVTAWRHFSGLMYCGIQGHSWIPSGAKRPSSRCCDGESTNLPSQSPSLSISPLPLSSSYLVAMMITQRARNVFPARVVQPDRQRQRPRPRLPDGKI